MLYNSRYDGDYTGNENYSIHQSGPNQYSHALNANNYEDRIKRCLFYA